MGTLDGTKSERLKAAITQMEHRWGTGVLAASRAEPGRVEGLSTTFPALDQLTGTGGSPLHAITLLSGDATCGKLTVAYKVLSRAQLRTPERRHSVAILDLGARSDPDYLASSGVDLDRLLLVRPQGAKQALRVLLDLMRSRELRAILLDSLSELLLDKEGANAVEQMMPQVNLVLKSADCALLLLDEGQAAWLPPLVSGTSRAVRHYASLHIEFMREEWIESAGELAGYQVKARLLKSRSQRQGESATIAISFDETVRVRETW